jgi:hypothetical protein
VQRPHRTVIASWSRRLGRVSPRVVDGVLAVAVAAAVSVTISVSDYPDQGTRQPDAFAYALAVAIGALTLARRRRPVGVLLASIVLLRPYFRTRRDWCSARRFATDRSSSPCCCSGTRCAVTGR